MNWLHLLNKKHIVMLLLIFVLYSDIRAAVYVYEVITKETSFHTASRLGPDAFLFYNGGEDTVYRLTVLKKYKDNEFDKALRDYGLEERNVKYIPHLTIPNDIPRRRYYWWR